MRTFAELYVIAACLFGKVAVSWWGLINVRLHYKSLFYKRATGVVTNVSTHTEYTGISEFGSAYSRLTHYSYCFEVDDQQFRGNTRDDFFGWSSAAVEGELHKGDEVTVYYDADNPADNRASRGGIYGGLFIVALGQGILAIAIDQTIEFADSRPTVSEVVTTDFPLAGRWFGYIEDPRIGTYNATVTLHNDSVGELSGRVRYFAIHCRTFLHFESAEEQRYTYRESLDGGSCKGNAVITLEVDGEDWLKWTSSPADEERTFKGVFKRQE